MQTEFYQPIQTLNARWKRKRSFSGNYNSEDWRFLYSSMKHDALLKCLKTYLSAAVRTQCAAVRINFSSITTHPQNDPDDVTSKHCHGYSPFVATLVPPNILAEIESKSPKLLSAFSFLPLFFWGFSDSISGRAVWRLQAGIVRHSPFLSSRFARLPPRRALWILILSF